MPTDWRFDEASCELLGKCARCKRWKPAAQFRSKHTNGMSRCEKCTTETKHDRDAKVQAKRYRRSNAKH